jgi:hypothetical protein
MSKVSAVLAVEEILVKHEGASNHQWHNVSFEYATWLRPMQGGGFVEQQTGACNVCPKGTPIPSEGWCAQQGPFLERYHFILKTPVLTVFKRIILPRQARDKHRENSKKSGVVRSGMNDDYVATPGNVQVSASTDLEVRPQSFKSH